MSKNVDAVPLPSEPPQSAEGAHDLLARLQQLEASFRGGTPKALADIAADTISEALDALRVSAARCARLEEELTNERKHAHARGPKTGDS